MNIRIEQLTLTNFKCFRHKEIPLDSNVTTICGRNGVGKTTIADAILWCLFGKNSAGQSTFSIKTHDCEGKEIPHLDHSVEMVLTTNAITGTNEITLKRTLKETWVKKRGAYEEVLKGHTTEYFINGDSYTAKDYEKYISTLVNEDIFRAITNPQYFPSLKWQQQRKFLESLVDMSDVSATQEELDGFLASIPAGQGFEEARKHLSYKIKQIKDKLDKIPVRLEEQNKALPEKLDWDAIDVQYADVSRQQKAVDEKIVAIRSGNGGDVLREEIRKEIHAIRTDMGKIEEEQRKLLRLRQDEQDRAINTARQQFNKLVSEQRDLEQAIPSFSTLAKRCRENADETFKKEQTYIRTRWAETQIDFRSSGETCCPVCGQTLPPDMMKEKEILFNKNKAALKATLTAKAVKAKELFAEAENEAKEYEQKKEDAEKTLTDIKEQINTAFAEKQKLEKVILPTLDDILKDNVQYVELLAKLKEQQAKLDSVAITPDDNAQLADLQAQKVQYAETLSQLQSQLATRTQYDKIIALIVGIEQEQKDLVTQLSKLEQQEDIAREYQDRMNAILEERVNRHFKIVKWRMFRTVNNGGDPYDEPYCECYVDGVAYHDGLNQAARLNAGLDIINALCSHYNVTAPIILDNTESTLNILRTAGQQIRLQVEDTDLQIFQLS